MNKLVFPEVVAFIVNQLNESDEDSPRDEACSKSASPANLVLSALVSFQHLSLQTMIAEHI